MLRRFIASGFLIAAMAFEIHSQAVAPQPKGTVPAAKQEEIAPAMAVPPDFKYETTGRRDPFVNPVPKPVKPVADVPVVRPPGLKGVLLSEAQVTGIVSSRETGMNRAVLSAPGGRIYFVQRGEPLFDAVVKDIQRDGVVFEQKIKDPDGKTITQTVTRKIRTTP